jgi:hypothetical protein
LARANATSQQVLQSGEFSVQQQRQRIVAEDFFLPQQSGPVGACGRGGPQTARQHSWPGWVRITAQAARNFPKRAITFNVRHWDGPGKAFPVSYKGRTIRLIVDLRFSIVDC